MCMCMWTVHARLHLVKIIKPKHATLIEISLYVYKLGMGVEIDLHISVCTVM